MEGTSQNSLLLPTHADTLVEDLIDELTGFILTADGISKGSFLIFGIAMRLKGCVVGRIIGSQLAFRNGDYIDAAIFQNLLIVEKNLRITAIGNCQQGRTGACQILSTLSRGGVHTETVDQRSGDLIPLHGCLHIVSQVIIQCHEVIATLHGQCLKLVVMQFQHIVLIVAAEGRVQARDRTGVVTHLDKDTVGNALTIVVGLDHFLIGILYLCVDIGSGIVNDSTAICFLGGLSSFAAALTATAGHQAYQHNCNQQQRHDFSHCLFHDDSLSFV